MEPVLVVLLYSSLAAAVAALGAVPHARRGGPRPPFVGLAEALASGLMLGTAYLLMTRALDHGELRSLLGAGLGVLYTFLVQSYAGTRELDGSAPAAPRPEYGYKVLLRMTLHSASEGVAIGVAMVLDLRLGIFLALALALHNIAEGIALTALLRECGMKLSEAAGLCVVTKSSQPLLALAIFALSPVLADYLASALGFAAGCLAFLVLTELLPDSYHRAGKTAIASLVTLAAGVVVLIEDYFA